MFLAVVPSLCYFFWQPWRAATLSPFGGLDQFPSVEALLKNGKDRTLQAIELESGMSHQWRLWRWASYCASEVELKKCCQTNFFSCRQVQYVFNTEFYCLCISICWLFGHSFSNINSSKLCITFTLLVQTIYCLI